MLDPPLSDFIDAEPQPRTPPLDQSIGNATLVTVTMLSSTGKKHAGPTQCTPAPVKKTGAEREEICFENPIAFFGIGDGTGSDRLVCAGVGRRSVLQSVRGQARGAARDGTRAGPVRAPAGSAARARARTCPGGARGGPAEHTRAGGNRAPGGSEAAEAAPTGGRPAGRPARWGLKQPKQPGPQVVHRRAELDRLEELLQGKPKQPVPEIVRAPAETGRLEQLEQLKRPQAGVELERVAELKRTRVEAVKPQPIKAKPNRRRAQRVGKVKAKAK